MNPPQRVRAVLDRARREGFAQNTGMVAVWTVALPLIDVPDSDPEDALALGLQALRAELDLTAAGLNALEVPSELFAEKLFALKSSMAPRHLGGNWGGMAGPLVDSEAFTILGWAAHFMPKEPELPEESLTELRKTLQELRSGLKTASLPPAIRAYAERQLSALERALAMYCIRGTSAVTDALETAYGVASRAKPMVAEEARANPEAAGVVNRVNVLLGRALEVCGSVDKAYKGGSALISMAEAVQKLIPGA